MHLIDAAGHVNNQFVHEDPGTNRPPTEIDAAWLNAVQNELSNAIKGYGIALDKNQPDQLFKVIKAAVAALLVSPTFTGVPKVPIPLITDNSTQIAPTGWVRNLFLRTPRDVLTSRAAGVTYTNNTANDIVVNVSGGAAAAQSTAIFLVGSFEFIGSSQPSQGLNMSVTAIVPPGTTYRVPAGNFSTITRWQELSL